MIKDSSQSRNLPAVCQEDLPLCTLFCLLLCYPFAWNLRHVLGRMMVRSASWCPQYWCDGYRLFWFLQLFCSRSVDEQARSAASDSLHSVLDCIPPVHRGTYAEDSPGGLVLVGGCGESTLTFTPFTRSPPRSPRRPYFEGVAARPPS